MHDLFTNKFSITTHYTQQSKHSNKQWINIHTGVIPQESNTCILTPMQVFQQHAPYINVYLGKTCFQDEFSSRISM